jgi:hypothetical protein
VRHQDAAALIWRSIKELAEHSRTCGGGGAVAILPGRTTRRGAGDSIQVYPGLRGRFVGEAEGRGLLVDIALADMDRWLERHKGWSRFPDSEEGPTP